MATSTTTTKKRGGFYWRAFVTFYIVLSFTVLAVSGIILYISPPGRIANWSKWSIALLDKSRWQAIHTILAFLFVVAAGFHVYFNWRVIVGYVKTRLSEGIRRKWELAGATGLIVGIVALTIGGVAPFQTVMDVGEELKNSWATPASEPPVPHAEEWTLLKMAENTKQPVEQVVANLQKAGYAVGDPDKTTLKAIATAAGAVPQEVFQKAKGTAAVSGGVMAEGGGWGRKTVKQVAEQAQVPLADAVARLKDKGISATADMNIRELAQAVALTPIDLAKIIQGPAAEPGER